MKTKLKKGKGLSIPKRRLVTEQKEGKLLQTFKTDKEQHLHSVSVSLDCENFLAADESRINMFNLHRSKDPIFQLIDYDRKAPSIDEERITSMTYSGNTSDIFLYTTSTGKINVCDLRMNSEFMTRPTMSFDVIGKNSRLNSNIFNKWTNCVSMAKFSSTPNQIFSRDYLSVKLWDMRMSSCSSESRNTTVSKPIYSAQVTDYMERNLSNLLDNDSIDDQFFLDLSPDSKYLATGAYSRCAHVIDANAMTNTVVNTMFGAERDSPAGRLKTYGKSKRLMSSNATGGAETKVDLKKRISLGSWAPQKDLNQGKHTLALVYRNCIYLYHNNTSKNILARTKLQTAVKPKRI